MFPKDSSYAYRLLVEHPIFSNTLTLVVYWLYGIFNAYLVGKIFWMFCFIVNAAHVAFFILSPLIHQELRFKNIMTVQENVFSKVVCHYYNTSAALRCIPNLIKFYRTLQLLQKYFEKSIGLLTFTGHLVMLQLCVCSQVPLITQWDKLNDLTKIILLDCYVAGNIIWLCSLDILGRLDKESSKTITSWKRFSLFVSWENKTNIMVMKKFRRSCKPLIISYGNFYFVR